MIKLTKQNTLLYHRGKIVWFDLRPWNIPDRATEIWINVSLKPGGVAYEVFASLTWVGCDGAIFPLPLASEIHEKIENFVTTTVYLEVWYA